MTGFVHTNVDRLERSELSTEKEETALIVLKTIVRLRTIYMM